MLEQCTSKQLLSIKKSHEAFDDETIDPFRNKIIEYIEKNAIDGKMLSKIKKKEFAESLISFNGNKRKIRGAANKTWTRLRNYKLHINGKYQSRKNADPQYDVKEDNGDEKKDENPIGKHVNSSR